ncbi:MAG: fluoride efflux transporter CrcB [Planctomycetota bacterium]|nr:fluoride efflux transporter CrcB [Planctomycetota bacterium]
MDKLVIVMVGGALGSGARWLVGVALAGHSSAKWPLGTLAVNVVGSYAMGLVTQLATQNGAFSAEKRLFIATGLLGGFTTYSSFNQETLDLVNAGAWTSALVYAATAAVVCLAAGFAGMATARALAAT